MIQAFYNFKTMPFVKDIKGDEIFLSAGSRELFQRHWATGPIKTKTAISVMIR